MSFLIRRLHSLSGLIPVGAYMVGHLLTNASVLESPATFQRAVYQIHSLGALLPVIEWGFIFLPILFHAVIGVVIIRGGLPNSGAYPLEKNVRYTLQRATGMIAFVFIVWHVFHMHGIFHFEQWLEAVKPLGGANFKPFNAASTLGAAMSGFLVPLLYGIGVLSCVYHLANGVWTMGITWGVWVSPEAQKRADLVCIVFGVGLAFVGLGALGGAVTVDEQAAAETEADMLTSRVISREVSHEQAEEKASEDGLRALEERLGHDDPLAEEHVSANREATVSTATVSTATGRPLQRN